MRVRRMVLVGAALAAVTALAVPAGAQEAPSTSTSVAPTPTTTVAPPSDAVDPTTTVAPSPTTTAAPATEAAATPEGGRSISGTIRGIDGNYVNAQISLVLRDSLGRFLKQDGTFADNAAIYAAYENINPTAPLAGSDSDTAGYRDTWTFRVPANAHDFTFEVYPRGPGSGEGNWTHYGGVSKRRVVIPANGLANVRLRLPLNCDQPGGTTGSIEVHHSSNGSPQGGLDNFLALSESNPPTGIQGFRADGSIPANDSSPVFDGIAPDQRYSVNIYDSARRLHAFYEVPVRACQTTHLYSWNGRSSKPPRWGRVGVSETGAFFPIVGEFSGDRRDDVFWYAPNAAGDKLSISSGATGHFTAEPLPVGAGYRPVAGDWNGDGVDDIFWYGPGSARDRIWQGGQGGDFTTVAASAGGSANTWPVSGDFDGNGHTDILWAEGGRLSTLRRYNADGYTNGSASVPANSQVRSGDINGDFRDDLLWHNPSTGVVQVWFGRADGTFLKVTEQVGAHVDYRPVLADVSGDFRADVIWYAPGSQPDRLWRGRSYASPYFAKESADLGVVANYSPFAGDWNGDGTMDVFWYAPGGAADVLWRMNLSGWIPQN